MTPQATPDPPCTATPDGLSITTICGFSNSTARCSCSISCAGGRVFCPVPAGGASGGDLLFHEVCTEIDIPTRLYLAIPSNDYVVASVDVPGQPHWIDRFRAVEKRCSTRELSRGKDLPDWLKDKPDYTIWQRNNLWTLHNALAFGGKNVTLIALWNGEAGDGPGGTQDMVQQARARGAKVIILDTKNLFGV